METHINTHKHTRAHIHTHAHTPTSTDFTLSCISVWNELGFRKHIYSWAHTPCSLHRFLGSSTVVETWGWRLQPWSKNVESQLKTPQRKRSLSVNQRQRNIWYHSPWYHNYRKDVHGFPCCDGNGDLLFWMAFLSYHCGLNNKVRHQSGYRECLSLMIVVDYSTYPTKKSSYIKRKKRKKLWSIAVGNSRALRTLYFIW